MRKPMKKLVLAKETVMALGASDMLQVAGAAVSIDYQCPTSFGPLRCPPQPLIL
jgi:hypothetical protein